MLNCKHCNSLITGNFCEQCGQAAKLSRVDSHYVLHEIQHVLHFEKGIFYTVKELLIRPGATIKVFLTEDRRRLVRPIIFIIITSLIYSSIEHFFHLSQGYIIHSSDTSHISAIFNWIENHYGYSNIMIGVFIALWVKALFRKHSYNFFETLILLCFLIGMTMLMLSFAALIEGLTNLHLLKISSMIGLLYCTWGIGHFFDKKKPSAYFKALVAYLLGMLSFAIVVIILGFLADLITKH